MDQPKVRIMEVNPVKIVAVCPAPFCGGEMHPTGVFLASNPPQYPHTCQTCGHEQRYDKQYPHIEFQFQEVGS